MNTEKVIKKIKELFPDKEIIKEADGWSSWAFSVGDRKIVRVAKGYFGNYEKEADILSFLKGRISVKIPQTEVVEDDFSYVIHDKIKGKDWGIGTYNNLSNKKKNLFCEDVAVFFSEIHSISLKEVDEEIPYLKDLSTQYKFSDILETLKGQFSSKAFGKIEDKIRSNEDFNSGKVLVHKDFHSANSLIDDNHRLSGVFDFVNSGIIDVHYEFLSLYREVYMEFLNRLINIYKDITNTQISLRKMDLLKFIDNLNCLTYLEKNSSVKSDKIRDFNSKMKEVYDFLDC